MAVAENAKRLLAGPRGRRMLWGLLTKERLPGPAWWNTWGDHPPDGATLLAEATAAVDAMLDEPLTPEQLGEAGWTWWALTRSTSPGPGGTTGGGPRASTGGG